jgi:hypothetical protein
MKPLDIPAIRAKGDKEIVIRGLQFKRGIIKRALIIIKSITQSYPLNHAIDSLANAAMSFALL